MAATTISHNRPTAGSITWTAFNIAYNGANFTIPAGNTAAKFVWWVYNAGAPRLLTGDILPELTADDTVLFLNKQGVGQLLPETTVVDGSLIVAESIYAQAIASDQIASRHIVSDAITTEHLAANSVTADQLSVGTVSANLVANGSFEDYDADGSVVGWEAIQVQGGTIAPVTGVSSSGAIAVQMNATATTALLRLSQKRDMFIPVSNASSRRWYVSARMGAGTAITKGAYLRAVWYDANKNRLTTGDYVDVGRSNAALTTTFTVYEGQVAPPAAARYLGIEIILSGPNVVTKMYVDEVTVYEVMVAANIGDGQITTPKLVAKSVTADKMVIRDSTNLLTDPGFEAGGSGWVLGSGTVATITAANVRPSGAGTKVLQMVATGANKDTNTDSFAVEAGEWYYASCWVRASVPTTSTGSVQLAATINLSAGGAAWPTFTQVAANTLTTAWQLIEGKVQIPAGSLNLALRPTVRDSVTSGTFQFDDFTLRRMNGGELIVDGQIKTNHMTANTISGDVIAANTLVGSKLVADSITSRELVTSEIWANQAWINAVNTELVKTNRLQVGANNRIPDPTFIDPIVNAERAAERGAGDDAAVGKVAFVYKPDPETGGSYIAYTHHHNPADIFWVSGSREAGRVAISQYDTVRVSLQYRVRGTYKPLTDASAFQNRSKVGVGLYCEAANKNQLNRMEKGDVELTVATEEWLTVTADFHIPDVHAAYVRPAILVNNPEFSGDVEFRAPSLQVLPKLSVRTVTSEGVDLETKLGLADGGADTKAPGMEFSRLYPYQGTPVGYRPARVVSVDGSSLHLHSGKPGGNSLNPIGETSLLMMGGNILAMAEGDTSNGKGFHSSGAITSTYNGGPKRIPFGILDMWEHSVGMTINSSGVTITQKTFAVPAFATIRVNVNLSGYSLTGDVFTDVRLLVDNGNMVRHVHDTGPGGSSSDINASLYYTSPYAYERQMTFRIVGTVAYPSNATYIVPPRSGGDGPSSTVTFEDIGSVYTPADPIPKRLDGV